MKHVITLVAAVALLASCTKSSIRGSGSTITETRYLQSFTGVRIEGSSRVTVTKGAVPSVQLTGYENLLPVYQTNIQNGVLVLKFRSDYYNIRNNNISIAVTVPSLAFASINGSGEMYIQNFSNGTRLNAEINGSGNIDAVNCYYPDASYYINGSGDIHARDIIAGNVEARISGSGKIETTCYTRLTARISGSGDVHYWGSPSVVDTQISGSGKVIRK